MRALGCLGMAAGASVLAGVVVVLLAAAGVLTSDSGEQVSDPLTFAVVMACTIGGLWPVVAGAVVRSTDDDRGAVRTTALVGAASGPVVALAGTAIVALSALLVDGDVAADSLVAHLPQDPVSALLLGIALWAHTSLAVSLGLLVFGRSTGGCLGLLWAPLMVLTMMAATFFAVESRPGWATPLVLGVWVLSQVALVGPVRAAAGWFAEHDTPGVDRRVGWLHVDQGRLLCVRERGADTFTLPGGPWWADEDAQGVLAGHVQRQLGVTLVEGTRTAGPVASGPGSSGRTSELHTSWAAYAGLLTPAEGVELAWLDATARGRLDAQAREVMVQLQQGGQLTS